VALDKGFNITITSVFFIDALEEYPAFFDLLESLGWPIRENLRVKFSREAYHGADEINSDYTHKIIDAFVNLKSMDKRSEYIVTGGLVPGLSRFMYEFKSYINGNFIQNAYRCDILRQASYVFSPTGYVFLCYSSPEVCKIGSYYPDVCIDENQIYRLSERNTLKMAKCTGCIYKTICRGGCVVSALESGFDISEPFCGVFSDESILNRFGELLF
jgi:radical SAM protein with 4Fe4S-binding SPASM domain